MKHVAIANPLTHMLTLNIHISFKTHHHQWSQSLLITHRKITSAGVMCRTQTDCLSSCKLSFSTSSCVKRTNRNDRTRNNQWDYQWEFSYYSKWSREKKRTQRICYSGRQLGQSICPQIIQISERFNSAHWLDEGFVRLKSWTQSITNNILLLISSFRENSLYHSHSGVPASLHCCVIMCVLCNPAKVHTIILMSTFKGFFN